MSMDRLTAVTPAWVLANANTPEPFVSHQCALMRNLSDFVFPNQCSNNERTAVESRIVRAITQCEAMPAGQYFSVADMRGTTLRMLAERRLTTHEMLDATGPRGVYLSEDQSLAVMINTSDHVVIRATTGGDEPDAAWALVNTIDEALGAALHFSYHERLGYLTSSLRAVGTGMRVSVLLHLPALAITGRINDLEQHVLRKRLALRGLSLGELHGPEKVSTALPALSDTTPDIEAVSTQSLFMDLMGDLATQPPHSVGHLFLLTNQDTLGLSEREMLVHTGQAANHMVKQEETARQYLLREHREGLLDCIGRALGIVRGARLLNLREAYLYASFIRLADALGLVVGCDRTALNKALLECQHAHLQFRHDTPMEAHSLCAERARIFRSLFTAAEIN